MANLLLILLLFSPFLPLSISGPVAVEFLYPNFTGSHFNYIDNSGGIFLTSPNHTFQAAIYNPNNQQSNFYLCVIHALSNTIIWSANRNSSISNSGLVKLTSSGLTVSLQDGTVVWSTPSFSSPVTSLRLLDSGNLLLLDSKNTSLWQSFQHPTDTLVPGQTFPSGSSLVSSTSTSNLSPGNFRLLLTSNDAVLQWIDSMQYWRLSTDQRANINANGQVSYMSINSSGLYLFSTRNDSEAIMTLSLAGNSDLVIARIETDGRFHVYTYSSATKSSVDLFVAPSNKCDLPLSCNSLGICSGGDSVSTSCTCPNLLSKTSGSNDCSPVDGRVFASPSVCNNRTMLSTLSYMSLGLGTDYFNSKFASPTSTSVSITSCESLCNANCSCLGFFYKNSTQDCFILEHQLGSLTSSGTDDAIGYIKTFGSASSSAQANNKDSSNLIAILLPTIAAGLLIVVLLVVVSQWWRRTRTKRGIQRKWKPKSIALREMHKPWPVDAQHSDDDDEFPSNEEILIPGLPTKFSYDQLQTATANFQTKIGSGGFGEVYKGVLEDKTLVAVKRVKAIGRKKEFFTEIAVIGSVHHINLVRLKGFCAQGSRRMLVYEYMNRGSLEKSLFRQGGPVLEWQERVDIAIGAARGLAYLHSGCEHKIIHCDVKPENILLHDGGQVKISDFGLAKMMTPEQSGLFTTMRGTRGYLAPEWLTNSAISDRTDVYSYGMVLLEIVRGRQNRWVLRSEDSGGWTSSGSNNGIGESEYFPSVALDMHEQGRYTGLADPRLEGRVTGEELERIVKIALCCLHEDPGLRPSMTAIVGMLEGTMPVPPPRVDLLNFLRLYGRGGNVMGHGGVGNAGVWQNRISNTTSTTSTNESATYTFLSSQQISGPR